MKIARVYKHGIHLGEEKIVQGNDSSGMVYFSGCHLSCTFCYTPEIAFQMRGKACDESEFERVLEDLVQRGARNLNLVSPTHVWSTIYKPLQNIRKRYQGLLPIVLKVSGFERLAVLEQMLEVADVMIPDFKVWASENATRVKLPASYGEVALKAILRSSKAKRDLVNTEAKMTQGVLVRHLLVPDCFEDSYAIVDQLAENGFKGHINFMTYFIDPNLHRVAKAPASDVAVLTTLASSSGMTPLVNGRIVERSKEMHYA